MKIEFHIGYHSAFGEDLILYVLHNEKTVQYRMCTLDGKQWNVCINEESKETSLSYYYAVERDGVEIRREWAIESHILELTAKSGAHYVVYDRWTDIPEDSYLYSSAYTECLNHHSVVQPKTTEYATTIRLKVRAPQLRSGQQLALTGAGRTLGDWRIEKVRPMVLHHYNEWQIDIDASIVKEGKLEFKFITVEENRHGSVLWETRDNRIVDVPAMKKGDVVVYELDQAFFEIENRRVAGTLVPVFSLRSKESFGIGDFGDLKKMVDFVAATHQSLLQVLPINDTTTTHTWTDSYPYSCISIFAIHPQYVDLTQLPAIQADGLRQTYEELRQELNALPQIDYERVNDAKTEYLKVIYAQEGKKMMASKGFKKFFSEAAYWLVPYAQYSYLRDKNGTADFSTWKGHEVWNEKDRSALSNPRIKAYQEVSFYYFVQYILNTQMEAVHEYARSRNVILKGDIPIGVNRQGCDVWMEPKYFHLDGQAGAPPDDFSVNGQNWGFPTYNWSEMLKDNCIWWVRRFQNMSKFFDAYRIDHVLGFFRIWEIPIDAVHGLLGQFSPSLGMSREEIEGYGLKFQEEQFTKPFIADWVVDRVFHEHAQEVKNTYLRHLHDDIWEMRPEYNTQRKVEAAFEGRTSEKDIWLRDGLYALISDVLFVRDRKDPNKFHPRISVQFDFVYEALYDCDKVAFNQLYNDYYYRRNNQFWYQEAMKKLPRLVQATRMLVCAEDLGMVPDCVSWVMNELRILSLELESMPKDPTVRFGYLSRNPYRSVCTISSHDMPTLRQWWDEDEGRTQDYYNSMLYRGGAAPHPLPGWLARDIILRHLLCPSMLCVLSIQDWLAIDERLRLPDANGERINIPANPKHYWRYRMHLNIEDLIKDKNFCNGIIDLINNSQRK